MRERKKKSVCEEIIEQMTREEEMWRERSGRVRLRAVGERQEGRSVKDFRGSEGLLRAL